MGPNVDETWKTLTKGLRKKTRIEFYCTNRITFRKTTKMEKRHEKHTVNISQKTCRSCQTKTDHGGRKQSHGEQNEKKKRSHKWRPQPPAA